MKTRRRLFGRPKPRAGRESLLEQAGSPCYYADRANLNRLQNGPQRHGSTRQLAEAAGNTAEPATRRAQDLQGWGSSGVRAGVLDNALCPGAMLMGHVDLTNTLGASAFWGKC